MQLAAAMRLNTCVLGKTIPPLSQYYTKTNLNFNQRVGTQNIMHLTKHAIISRPCFPRREAVEAESGGSWILAQTSSQLNLHPNCLVYRSNNFLQPTSLNKNVLSVAFSTSSIARSEERKQLKVFTLQNPATLFRVWWKFREVRLTWDPTLEKEQFLSGAKQAAVTVLRQIKDGSWAELRGLLEKKELERLQREVETQWSDVQRHTLELEAEDLTAWVTDLRTQQIVQRKWCDVDVVLVGLAQTGRGQVPRPVRVNVSFLRNYTEGQLPDWSITRFRVN